MCDCSVEIAISGYHSRTQPFIFTCTFKLQKHGCHILLSWRRIQLRQIHIRLRLSSCPHIQCILNCVGQRLQHHGSIQDRTAARFALSTRCGTASERPAEQTKARQGDEGRLGLLLQIPRQTPTIHKEATHIERVRDRRESRETKLRRKNKMCCPLSPRGTLSEAGQQASAISSHGSPSLMI